MLEKKAFWAYKIIGPRPLGIRLYSDILIGKDVAIVV